MLHGSISRKYSLALHPNPCSNLSKAELEQETRGRYLTVTNNLKSTLQQALSSDLRGEQRVPALLFSSSESSPGESLTLYEVFACEPMHDIAGHIGNVLQELPHHLPT